MFVSTWTENLSIVVCVISIFLAFGKYYDSPSAVEARFTMLKTLAFGIAAAIVGNQLGRYLLVDPSALEVTSRMPFFGWHPIRARYRFAELQEWCASKR